MRTLLIDNYDSFTFNLYQELAEIGGEVPLVVRNDQLSLAEVGALEVDCIVISPGPGRPERAADFGICQSVLRTAEVPVLGVCLGCQGLGAAFGARVVSAPEPMHGRLSAITHEDADLFAGLPQGFQAVRYHSLMVDPDLPPELRRIAWTEDGVIMGLRHRTRPLWGIQFHPESICSEHGLALLRNFRAIAMQHAERVPRPPHATARVDSPATILAEGKPMAPVDGALVAHWRKVETRVAAEDAFARLFSSCTHSFWLDSSLVVPGVSRYSFMGEADAGVLTHVLMPVEGQDMAPRSMVAGGDDFFAQLKRELADNACKDSGLPFDFCGGLVGFFGYEMKAACGGARGHASPYPDAAFMRVRRFLAFDHQEQAVYLVFVDQPEMKAAAEVWFAQIQNDLETAPLPATSPAPEGGAGIPEPKAARSRTDYLHDVGACRELIAAGESYEICLTNMLTVDVDVDVEPLRYYGELRRLNPAPYAAFLRFGELAVLSSSPERFLRIDRERMVESKPIKGTVPRGSTPAEDVRLREGLRGSVKNRAENLMIVDLMRNDLGIVCEIGSVRVPRLMDIESYATVHQMVSTVRGHLRPDIDAVEAVRQAFPAGSMTGAPKRRTMAILDQLETQARGVYSGACGYFSLNGTADFSVVIRTAVVTPGRVSIGVGGAVVALSDPAEEYGETQLKAQVLLSALAAAGGGGTAGR